MKYYYCELNECRHRSFDDNGKAGCGLGMTSWRRTRDVDDQMCPRFEITNDEVPVELEIYTAKAINDGILSTVLWAIREAEGGGSLLAIKPSHGEGEYVLMCYLPNSVEFITWRFNVESCRLSLINHYPIRWDNDYSECYYRALHDFNMGGMAL